MCLYTIIKSDTRKFKSCALGGASLNGVVENSKKHAQNCSGGDVVVAVVHGESLRAAWMMPETTIRFSLFVFFLALVLGH